MKIIETYVAIGADGPSDAMSDCKNIRGGSARWLLLQFLSALRTQELPLRDR